MPGPRLHPPTSAAQPLPPAPSPALRRAQATSSLTLPGMAKSRTPGVPRAGAGVGLPGGWQGEPGLLLQRTGPQPLWHHSSLAVWCPGLTAPSE